WVRRQLPLSPHYHRWGIYFKHGRVTTEAGEQHCFNVLSFNGPGEEQPPPPRLELFASMLPRLFCDLKKPADRSFRTFELPGENKSFARTAAYTPDPNNAWVEIQVTVCNGRAEATCRPGLEEAEKFEPITPAEQEAFKEALGWMYPDLKPVPRQQLDGSALGIYLREAVCVVRRFEVETLDDK